MRRLPLLLALLSCTACSPIIIQRPGPPPPPPPPPPPMGYAPAPPVVYALPPPERHDERRSDRDRDERPDRWIDAAIDRAFRELLERAPDPEGRAHYADLLRHGLTEEQMWVRIRESVEYRVTLPDSKTTRAYHNVLGRAPDPSGLQSYRKKIVDEHWSERDVENDLRRSAEYRERQRSQPPAGATSSRDRNSRPPPASGH